jgi:hypothetical protein
VPRKRLRTALVAADHVDRVQRGAVLDRSGRDVVTHVQRGLLRVVADAIHEFGGDGHRLRPLVGFHFLLRRTADRARERQHAEGEHDERDQHFEQRESARRATFPAWRLHKQLPISSRGSPLGSIDTHRGDSVDPLAVAELDLRGTRDGQASRTFVDDGVRCQRDRHANPERILAVDLFGGIDRPHAPARFPIARRQRGDRYLGVALDRLAPCDHQRGHEVRAGARSRWFVSVAVRFGMANTARIATMAMAATSSTSVMPRSRPGTNE